MTLLNLDNLAEVEKASASEMEQAIIAFETEKAEGKPEAVEVKEPQTVEPDPKQPEIVEPETKAQAVEPDNYDYRKGYEGLRAWNTRLSQEVSELKKSITVPKKEQPVMTQEEVSDWQSRDPAGFARYVADIVTQEKIKPLQDELGVVRSELNNNRTLQAVSKVRERIADFKDFEEVIKTDISRTVRENMDRVNAGLPPKLFVHPDNYEEYLEDTYWKVKGKHSVEIQKKVKDDKQVEKLQKAQDLKDSYVVGSGKSEPEKPFNLNKASSDEIMQYMRAKGIVSE